MSIRVKQLFIWEINKNQISKIVLEVLLIVINEFPDTQDLINKNLIEFAQENNFQLIKYFF